MGPTPSFEVVLSFTLRLPDSPDAAPRRYAEATIGRAETATLRLDDERCSQFHVSLEARNGSILVTDLESTNGTYVDGDHIFTASYRRAFTLRLGQSRVEVLPSQWAAATEGTADIDPDTDTKPSLAGLVAVDPSMLPVVQRLSAASQHKLPLLILGETGTGKDVAARAVHEASERSGRFVALNCGALPKQLVEGLLFGHARGAFSGADQARKGAIREATGGTLFLDEIGELPLDMQPTLLRFLESGEVRPLGERSQTVDVRVIAATNRDLRKAINQGSFRADLYYRLARVPVTLPPLRSRKVDLPHLVSHLVGVIRQENPGVSLLPFDYEEHRAFIEGHDWPGNVRELKNHLELALIHAPLLVQTESQEEVNERISELALPAHRVTRQTINQVVEEAEKRYLRTLLAETGGVVVDAAKRADVNRRTLFRKLKRYGIRYREDS